MNARELNRECQRLAKEEIRRLPIGGYPKPIRVDGSTWARLEVLAKIHDSTPEAYAAELLAVKTRDRLSQHLIPMYRDALLNDGDSSSVTLAG